MKQIQRLNFPNLKTGCGGVSHILSLGKSAYAVKLFTQHPRTIFVDLILWRMPARYGVGGGMGKINITPAPNQSEQTKEDMC